METASAAEVHVSLLGGFSVMVNGQPMPDRWRLRKAKVLVKLLALAPGHWLHRDLLVDILWSDIEPEAAANNLHQIVYAVRRMMGAESITLSDDVVRLCPTARLTVDVDQFEQAAGAAAAAARSLRCIKRSICGPAHYSPKINTRTGQQQRERLGEIHAALTALLGSMLSEQGESAAALALVEPLATARPLDEHLHRVLINSLTGVGRRWEAIEAYERLRDALEEEYAAEPEPETKALYRRLLTGGKPIPATIPHNLPTPPTSFVGRRRLLTELTAGLGRTRLLTLTGVGGVGKSRLALELARLAGAGPDFPDGVWLVELAGVQDPEIVVSTVADRCCD